MNLDTIILKGSQTFYGKDIHLGLKTTALEIMRIWGAECRFFLFPECGC